MCCLSNVFEPSLPASKVFEFLNELKVRQRIRTLLFFFR
ncbi:hypothetical protein KSS87_010218 [Heliosperma pusillum]|nr:hypothetical protein KSS87_010218 [Heliosperma pusillum]